MTEAISEIFPKLTRENSRATSPKDPAYNCVAWAAGETRAWWDHLYGYWPENVKREGSIAAYVDVFVLLGFERCATSEYELGFEKIAVFGNGGQFTHAARQLPSGLWTSKLGSLEDIEHQDLASVSIPDYGRPVQFLRRGIGGGKQKACND